MIATLDKDKQKKVNALDGVFFQPEKPDLMVFSNAYLISNVSVPALGDGKKRFCLELKPKSSHHWIDFNVQDPLLTSQIKYMSEYEYDKIFGDVGPDNLSGRLVGIAFGIPSDRNSFIGRYECQEHVVEEVSRHEVFSTEKGSAQPYTVVALSPKCCSLHAPIAYGGAHYYLKMLYYGQEFEKFTAFFESQRGEYEHVELDALRKLSCEPEGHFNLRAGSFPKKNRVALIRKFDLIE